LKNVVNQHTVLLFECLSGEWMIPVNQENLARSAAPAADAASPASEAEQQEDTTQDRQQDSLAVSEVKGDPEMAPVFLRHLLPVFTHVFQGTMVQSVRYVYIEFLLLLL